MFLTLIVLNEDKSIESKKEQQENIHFIFVILVVLNEDKSIDFKDLQS